MLLMRIRIQGFRSLLDVELKGLGRLNVLIGRNNAGKSSVLRSIQHLAESLSGAASNDLSFLTDSNSKQALSYELEFDLEPDDRRILLDNLEAGQPGTRPEAIRASALATRLRYTFRSPQGSPMPLNLHQTLMSGEDGAFSTVQEVEANPDSSNPVQRWFNLSRARDLPRVWSGNAFTAGDTFARGRVDAAFSARPPSIFHSLIADYFRETFFLGPHRRANTRDPAKGVNLLTADGSNLPQLLHAIQASDPPKFSRIEQRVQRAVPDVGRLVAPLIEGSGETFVGFRNGGRTVPLADMGTGIQELLMVAAIVETTGGNLFLEEPEAHLHPGAQRFLGSLLSSEAHQAFVTTHSPTFLSPDLETSVHHMSTSGGRSRVKSNPTAFDMDAVLAEIGARNSDILLSDGVLFVEGPSDGEVFAILGETTGNSIGGSRVTVLPLGGTDRAEAKAKARSEVLEGISKRVAIPHRFIVDRDERSAREIDALGKLPAARVLKRRELENYLLAPGAIREALLSKHQADPPIRARIEGLSEDDIRIHIAEAADALKPVVLLRRIREEIGGLREGLLTREDAHNLVPFVDRADFVVRLRRSMRSRVDSEVSLERMTSLVAAHKKRLNAEWRRRSTRAELAPGQEILEAVYTSVGSSFRKTIDGPSLARHMQAEDVPAEMLAILNDIATMTA